ncbi:MAG: hypothetical protein DWQ37_00745 [Planctomycetota bacterium]|nr:MAG: hypothetical protein DWQ37_00745 [Planctomycetota bacterium]
MRLLPMWISAYVLMSFSLAPAWAGQEATPESPVDDQSPSAVEKVALPPTLSVEDLTEKVARSIVVISPSGRDGRRSGVGTGFVISSDGLIATNFHVIGEGRALRVQLADGRQVDATAVHASDRALDLAVLRVDEKDLPALELGDSDKVRQGESIIALGNPQGLENSVVSGVVSGVREMDGRKMIQMAIPIEPGNSGGPVVDAEGRVQGIVTMKSVVTPNLGFALAINLIKPLLDKPNPIPMSRWQTIGALDPREWQTVFGANWRQRAGRILVDSPGDGFGGRSLCLVPDQEPKRPYEVTVTVRLDDESGAAGLAFCSDGRHRHYGFYPSGGRMRFTRFDGPDIRTWRILYNETCPEYEPGAWNTLRVRLEGDRIQCFVNDTPVWETHDSGFRSGQVGLVKFRDTEAEFKRFQFGPTVERVTVPEEQAQRIVELVEKLPSDRPPSDEILGLLAADPRRSASVLRDRAAELEREAERLRELAQAAHERRTTDDLMRVLSRDEPHIDLSRACLLVAKLDNEEVDVSAYCQELERMADEIFAKLPEDPSDADLFAALRKYMFEENGFHGSRGDYYNRANSYLNEVLDDREGLPLTLSVVYMELARRLGLNVVGVGLPGHFVVAYVPPDGEWQLIDVYDGAKPISRENAIARIKEASEEELADDQIERFFEPATKQAIVFRMLQNLLSPSRGDPAALHRYLNAMLAIEPSHVSYHWLRAMVRYELGQRAGAREDVAWLLEREPEGILLEQVRALEARLDGD